MSDTATAPAPGSSQSSAATSPAPPWSRANPFPARLAVNRRLSTEESEKETRHFELDLTGWGLNYEPGDSIAVYPTNDPELVEQIIRAIGATGDEVVPAGKTQKPFRQALLRDYSITQPTPKLLRGIAQAAPSAPLLDHLLEPARKQDLDNYLYGMEVIDFLIDHPSLKFAPEQFVGWLTKLQPRLYSVASSLRVCPEQVHLIVDVIRYESHGRQRKGVCSTFLADRADNIPVPVYPTSAKHFHLPEDSDTPIIMVGPGTGIAPFRAFLQERKAAGAAGQNWLFFGAQREQCDSYYNAEFEELMREGLLTRFDCAWSRDQAQKVYVQNKMMENAEELWTWLDRGAHFYVCGDAKRMAKDVDATLRQIVQEKAGKTLEQAQGYVEQLKAEKRYKRDVY